MKKENQQKSQKKKTASSRRFNPWLFLVCLLLAVVIWCAIMYIEDPNGLRESAAQAALLFADCTV